MKHLLILTVGICLLISVPSMADQAEDEAAIREACEQLFAPWVTSTMRRLCCSL